MPLNSLKFEVPFLLEKLEPTQIILLSKIILKQKKNQKKKMQANFYKLIESLFFWFSNGSYLNMTNTKIKIFIYDSLVYTM